MSNEEQQKYRSVQYAEAMRYMENANASLQKACKEDKFYRDKKYVRSACGIAYGGVLVALDAFLVLRGVEMPKKKRRSIEFYEANVAKLDKKLLNYLNAAYDILHLSGYYDGILNAHVIKEGFECAYEIIGKINPIPDAE